MRIPKLPSRFVYTFFIFAGFTYFMFFLFVQTQWFESTEIMVENENIEKIIFPKHSEISELLVNEITTNEIEQKKSNEILNYNPTDVNKKHEITPMDEEKQYFNSPPKNQNIKWKYSNKAPLQLPSPSNPSVVLNKEDYFTYPNNVYVPKIFVAIHLYKVERWKYLYQGWAYKFAKYRNVKIITFSGHHKDVVLQIAKKDHTNNGLWQYMFDLDEPYDFYLKFDDDIFLYADQLMEYIFKLTEQGKLEKPLLLGSLTIMNMGFAFTGGNGYLFNHAALELMQECPPAEVPIEKAKKLERIKTHDDVLISWWLYNCGVNITWEHGIMGVWPEMYIKRKEIEKWEEEGRELASPLMFHKIYYKELSVFFGNIRKIPMKFYNFQGESRKCRSIYGISYSSIAKPSTCIDYIHKRFKDTVRLDGFHLKSQEDIMPLLKYMVIYATGGMFLKNSISCEMNVNDLLKKAYDDEREMIIYEEDGEIVFLAAVEKSDTLWLIIRDNLWKNKDYTDDFGIEFVYEVHQKWTGFIKDKIWYLTKEDFQKYFT